MSETFHDEVTWASLQHMSDEQLTKLLERVREKDVAQWLSTAELVRDVRVWRLTTGKGIAPGMVPYEAVG